MQLSPEQVLSGSDWDSTASPRRTLGDLSLSVVIPVYNSEDTIGSLVDRVIDSLEPRFREIEIVLVNDGSADRSHEEALKAVARYPDRIRYYRLARNFGEHNAVMCGLRMSTKDAAAIIDDDFQNPPEEIVKLCERLLEGYDVVYSYYAKKQHNLFRNLGSRFNDLVASVLLKKPPDLYLSSFKVLNRFLVNAVTAYDGPYPYVDALILQSTTSIGRQLCAHEGRRVGRSNYTLARLFRLWANMSTSTSLLPLRFATMLGFLTSIAGLGMALFFMVSRAFGGIFIKQEIPPGWASIIVSVTMLSGLQLLVLGIIGEYLGRLFITQNKSPQSIIREKHEPPHDASR